MRVILRRQKEADYSLFSSVIAIDAHKNKLWLFRAAKIVPSDAGNESPKNNLAS